MGASWISSSCSNTESIWNFLENHLPASSYIYGGQRFDSHPNNNHQDPSWNDFGNETALWFLPTIELRRTTPTTATTTTTTTAAAAGGTNPPPNEEEQPQQPQQEQDLTLAVHIVVDYNSTTTPFPTALQQASQQTLQLLQQITDDITSNHIPPTTLPPVLYRESSYHGHYKDGQELYENGVTQALEVFRNDTTTNGTTTTTLEKVVLARRMDLYFNDPQLSGLDILRKWKYNSGNLHEGGHLFYIRPKGIRTGEFFGCTPERLFQIHHPPRSNNNNKNNNQEMLVTSEALAGTRRRGTTQQADEELTKELFESQKDRNENLITGRFIQNVFMNLHDQKLIHFNQNLIMDHNYKDDTNTNTPSSSNHASGFFVRRLRHLQHICQRFSGTVLVHPKKNVVLEVTKQLLTNLHPTPAVCGYPPQKALDFIRDYESIGFDRGYYSGPIGYIGRDTSDILVAIRSGLVTQEPSSRTTPTTARTRTKVSVYAGAGLVKGSTIQSEWAETTYKLEVISSLFAQSPISSQIQSSITTPNSAWATAFVEELIRNGVTQFYVCPGSRSTPLVVAIAKAMQRSSNVGIVNAVSVHDERGAGFRAVGYGRGTGCSRPAAILTSSGTAIANLYPAIIEASMDGIPMIVLTADRPYENRDTGANQSIDQVKAFSSTYIRWFRDILPPSDEVPVSVALGDASHAVSTSQQLRGPVHMNVQFRENLAPDNGPIRNDNRVDSIIQFNGLRFTDVPGYKRWSTTGNRWMQSYHYNSMISSNHNFLSTTTFPPVIMEIGNLLLQSKRGMIVVGNIRNPTDENQMEDITTTMDIISKFAELVGLPIVAGVQSSGLRYSSSAVIPYAEYVLKHPIIAKHVKPDFILQIGSPLLSTEIPNIISNTMKEAEEAEYENDTNNNHDETPQQPQDHHPQQRRQVSHVLLHPHHGQERADPNFTVTHKISTDISSFLKELLHYLDSNNNNGGNCGSELSSLIALGRKVQSQMDNIIDEVSKEVIMTTTVTTAKSESNNKESMTEPQAMRVLSHVISKNNLDMSLFLSNSMPIRDAELFLYPSSPPSTGDGNTSKKQCTGSSTTGSSSSTSHRKQYNNSSRSSSKSSLLRVGSNRGASGIDGIISSALGYSEASGLPTSLVIGDLAALHDINSLHALGGCDATSKHPLTTIIINNDGGGIFSFLPIAQHGRDVSFDEFFGTPTNTFSFQKGCEAYGLSVQGVSDPEKFQTAYSNALRSSQSSVIEVKVVDRETNVVVHKKITAKVNSLINAYLEEGTEKEIQERLPIKIFARDSIVGPTNAGITKAKTLVLLHGWMGDKTEWEEVGTILVQSLPEEWTIVSVDIPGHGETRLRRSSEQRSIRSSLDLDRQDDGKDRDLSVDQIAKLILNSLAKDHGVKEIDALAGYSLGGRVALAMRRQSLLAGSDQGSSSVKEDTKMILLSSYPGDIHSRNYRMPNQNHHEDFLRMQKDDQLADEIENICNRMDLFLPMDSDREILWYEFLQRWYGSPIWGDLKHAGKQYQDVIGKRSQSLSWRGRDLASVLRQCSPPRNNKEDWKCVSPLNTLFLAGSLDSKYSGIGELWSKEGVNYVSISKSGHALLVEAPTEVAVAMSSFIISESTSQGFTPSKPETSASTSVYAPIGQENDSLVYNAVEETTASVDPTVMTIVESLDFESFTIEVSDQSRGGKGVSGIGWGEKAKVNKSNSFNQRSGFIIQMISNSGSEVGVGEVSPLSGLHKESLEEAEMQLNAVKLYIEKENIKFDAAGILSCDGYITEFLNSIAQNIGDDRLLPSVKSGLEMALISLASQTVGLPLHLALSHFAPEGSKPSQLHEFLPLNGLVTRGSFASTDATAMQTKKIFPSLKVKVGHQDLKEDAIGITRALRRSQVDGGSSLAMIRADANRAWNNTNALEFAEMLEGLAIRAVDWLEFIEEPLEKQYRDGAWSFEGQVNALEWWYKHTGIPYALDESLADLAEEHNYDFSSLYDRLQVAFQTGDRRGCVALVLKPSLLGLELSLRLARKARMELGIAAVFSSSFDSGIGLAYASFLGAVSDGTVSETRTFPHGVATYTMFAGDTLSPSFSSYVNDNGILNIPSLARAFYGLGLDEIRDSFVFSELSDDAVSAPSPGIREVVVNDGILDNYEVSTATSSSGREINVAVSLPLPFSAEIACSRFTDLPQMSRWAPWIRSVKYVDAGRETEWILNIRGVEFRWGAVSTLLETPYRGIRWESISGLKNRGVVEFLDTGENTCLLKLRMTVLAPRILASLFRSTSVFVEDFLRNKLLKWSLEMFRDVVKGDLALERGDVDLGDALFGAVEGKASAIEATLSSSHSPDDDDVKE